MRCPGQRFAGQIEAIDPLIDANGRSLLVRARHRQPGRRAASRACSRARASCSACARTPASCPKRRWCRRAASSSLSRWSTGPTAARSSQRIEARIGCACRARSRSSKAWRPATLVVTAGPGAAAARRCAAACSVVDIWRAPAQARAAGAAGAPGRRRAAAGAPRGQRHGARRAQPSTADAGRPPCNISEISIRRPVFATVLSLLIVLVGLVSLQPADGARVPQHRRAGGHGEHRAMPARRPR